MRPIDIQTMAINGQTIVAMQPGSVTSNSDEVSQEELVVVKVVVVHRYVFFANFSIAPSLTVGFLPLKLRAVLFVIPPAVALLPPATTCPDPLRATYRRLSD